MSRGDLEKLTVTQLRALAREVGVSVPPRATKDAIVQLLVRVRGAQAARVASASLPAGAGRKSSTRGTSRGKGESRKPATPAGRSRSKAAPVERTARGTATTAARAERKSAGARTPSRPEVTPDRPRRKTPASEQAARGRERRPAEQPAARQPRSPGATPAAPASETGRPVHGADTTEAAARRGIEPARSLPSEYGVDRLALLARDPRWVFAYWELSEPRVRDVLAHAGREPRLVLRVYQVTGSGDLGRFRDWTAEARIGRMYVELDVPGGVFVAEIGARAVDGTFVPAARSDAAHLPPDRPSPHVDRAFRPEGPVEAPAGGLPTSPGLGGESGAAGGARGAAGLPTSPGLPGSPGLPSSPSPWASPSSPAPWGSSPTSPGGSAPWTTPTSSWGTSPSATSPWGTSPGGEPTSPRGLSSFTSPSPGSPGLPSSPRSGPDDSNPGDADEGGLPPRRS